MNWIKVVKLNKKLFKEKRVSFLMRRGIEDKAILERFVEEFCKAIGDSVKYIICSGFVAQLFK